MTKQQEFRKQTEEAKFEAFSLMCKKVAELEKENAELKEQNEKWFVFETEAGNWGMDKATQYTVDRHNYFYGTKNECQIWAVEHKIKDYTGHKYCYDRLDDQLEQAKEIIKELIEDCKSFAILSDCEPTSKEIEQAKELLKNIIRVTWGEGWNYSLDWKVKAEQFLNEVEK